MVRIPPITADFERWARLGRETAVPTAAYDINITDPKEGSASRIIQREALPSFYPHKKILSSNRRQVDLQRIFAFGADGEDRHGGDGLLGRFVLDGAVERAWLAGTEEPRLTRLLPHCLLPTMAVQRRSIRNPADAMPMRLNFHRAPGGLPASFNTDDAATVFGDPFTLFAPHNPYSLCNEWRGYGK